MAVKLNNSNDYEPIKIVLTKEQYPIAYNNKVEELVEEGCYNSKEECELDNPTFEIECELYYEKGYGLFAVEEGAVESGTIYSPYSREMAESYDEE